jgi:uncharacterized protein (DUF2252 family)
MSSSTPTLPTDGLASPDAAGHELQPLPPSTAERIAAGRRLRGRLPRRELGRLSAHDRRPLDILAEQNTRRLQDLLPLRAERMSESPFAFYRGTAALMAADLAADDHSGILVPSCGDAHVSNFGFFASPQRTLVFDLNDFDEAAWAPWEWDLKRLVTSVVVAGQSTSRDESVVHDAVFSAVRGYAAAMRAGTELSPTGRFYMRIDAEGRAGVPDDSRRVLRKAIKQARKRTGERAVKRLTQVDDHGRLHFVYRAPTMRPLAADTMRQLQQLLRRYLDTASPDIYQLLHHYRFSDAARRVVGVGSVGTRCALNLLQDGDGNALILQSKEAGRSVLEQYGGISQPGVLSDHVEQHGEGARVVALQRVLQAVSDPFLGHLRFDGNDLYVRQFHDMKGGIEADQLDDEPFVRYAQACGVTLARAHSQSPLAAMVSGYLGRGAAAGRSLLEWGYAYAERSKQDYEQFLSSLD